MTSQKLAMYATVGTIGFIVDSGIFSVLLFSHFNPYVSRAVSFPAAVFVTWILNRHLTFGNFKSRSWGGKSALPLYLGVQSIGALLNLSIFVFLELLDPLPYLPELAYLGFGSLISMFVTYYLSSNKVFN